MLIHIPKTWSLWDVVRSWEGHKPKRETTANWVASTLVEQRHAILLCTLCRSKFDHRRYHYVNATLEQALWGGGDCDGCGETSDQHFLYMPEQNVAQCMVTRDERLARARAKAGG